MKKKYTIEVDCANCAAKIEEAIRKIPGVNSASISFMTQKLVLDADDDCYDRVLQDAQKICKKVDADSRIVL